MWATPVWLVTLSPRDFDPRSGAVNWRLKNLKKGQPDAALVCVPAHFTKPVRTAPRASSGPSG